MHRRERGAPVNREECIELLSKTGRPVHSLAEDVTAVLQVGNERILVSSSEGTISSDCTETVSDKIPVFTFDAWGTAAGILRGSTDLGSAFLDGKLRSNGYLTALFPLMAMFQVGPSQSAPD